MKFSVLVVDDNPVFRQLLSKMVSKLFADADVHEYDPSSDGQGRPSLSFPWRDYDIMLLDYNLGHDLNGIDWLKEFSHIDGFPVTIFLTGEGDERVAVKAMRLGSLDYIPKKELNPVRLKETIEEALDEVELIKPEKSIVATRPLDLIQDAEPSSTFIAFNSDIFSQGDIQGGNVYLNDYRILGKIGKGGMADVYEALSPQQQIVAIKVTRPGDFDNDEYLDRFLEEGNILSQVSHTNIVKIYESGFTDDYGYIAMELLSAESLQTRKVLPKLQTVIRYSAQLAAGLQALHEKNIVHRDVKASNVLFREDDTPVLTDFGIAKNYGNMDMNLTMVGSTVGTPAFMSPEQVLCKEITPASDLYSLGILIYKMLTGSVPFRDKNPATLMYHQVHTAPPRLEGDLHGMEIIVERLLQKEAERRYSSAQELHDVLVSLLAEDDLKKMSASY